MIDTGLLSTLVKLASIGASGISIFAIFWIGWLLHQRADSDNPEAHKTLRYFMGMCLIIAIIAAASGITNIILDVKRISELEAELNAIRPSIKILTHPSTNVKPNGEVCLIATWTEKGTISNNIEYNWRADDGNFEPSVITKTNRAKWIAPTDIPPTIIKINVTAVDARTGQYIGVGEETRIGIISLNVEGQPNLPSLGNC
jgi:hypothetical protein